MEKIHCDTLLKYRRAFIDDVDVSNGIIGPLTSEYILKDDDVQKILQGKTKEERATILLDILPRCGPFAFDVLSQALKHHYRWLSVVMEGYLEKAYDMSTNDAGNFIDLPPVPPLSVPREEKVNEFKQDLRKLEPGKHLALHGLKGFGKSCLTVITLKDTNLVAEFFQNEIYWIKFCYNAHKFKKRHLLDERKIDDDILIQLNVLYQRIKKSDTIPTPLKSEPLKECLIRLIKLHFCQKQHESALLILGDVYHKKIVDTFDFGCKILVITDDLSVVKQKRPITFKVRDGFTEAESLGLFAKVLDLPIDRLPPEAKKIHDECKGMPLLISMFSAQFEDFKEQMIDDRAKWNYYLSTLRKRDPKNRAIQKQTAIFDMCIDKLPFELKELYYELSIFSEDVNIMPKTLEILWGIEPFDVDEKMLTLCHKSLAARQWNDELKSYVYTVHDLLLSHLRMKLNPQILKKKHQSFIRKYRDVCKDDFSKLSDDNYIYSYIGLHLEQAQLYELFSKFYLDLEFVQAKILNAGLSDVLIDLEKYKEYITQNELEVKRADLHNFLKSHTNIVTKFAVRKILDIVQIALIYQEEGFVLDESRKLAKKRNSDLYFSNSKNLENEGMNSLESVSNESTVDSYVEDISALCFTDEPNSLLLASKKGNIILKNVDTNKSNYFHGFFGKNITKLVLSHAGNYFLALTDEGKAKLFCINDEENANGNRDRNPREKQKMWTGVFTNKQNEDNSLRSFAIDDDKLSDVAFSLCDNFIAGCTPKNIIKVWKTSGEELQSFQLTHGICLEKITFTSDSQNNILMHTMGNNGVLISYQFCNTSFQYKSQYNPQIKERDEPLKTVFFKRMPKEHDSVILVTTKKALHIKWLHSLTRDQIHSYTKEGEITIDDRNSIFVEATITYDGQYLITAESDGFIRALEIHNNFAPVAIYKVGIQTRICLDTYWMAEEGYHLICGNENRLIHKWELKEVEVPKPLNKPLFNALMKPLGQDDMVVKRTSENRLAIFQGSQATWRKIAETDIVDGTFKSMIFAPDGSKLIYDVLKDQKQEIFIFHIETQTSTRIMQPKNISKFFVKSINSLEDSVVIQENDYLRVCTGNVSVLQEVNGPGKVISIYEMTPNEILTVKENFMIVLWNVLGNEWVKVDIQNDVHTNSNAVNSTLSPKKSLLAVLHEDQKNLVLYEIRKNLEVEPVQISIHVHHANLDYESKITCFKFSKDDKYLAVGLETGAVSIFEVSEMKEIHKLSVHCGPVCELHWAPVFINVPILLSVNADELIWWNVEPVLSKTSRKKSRMGLSAIMDNVPSPRTSLRLKNVQSNETKANVNKGTNSISSQSREISGNLKTSKRTDSVDFWKSKEIKKGQPGLLGLVPLPSSTSKVCVSEDFKKFLIINNTEHISIFEPFGLSDI